MTESIHSTLPSFIIQKIVRNALEEDLGRGDLTTDACVPNNLRGAAALVARKTVVISGLEVFREVYSQVDPTIAISLHAEDGDKVAAGHNVATVYGSAGSILRGERVALNFVQRMSGVASLTRQYVEALPAGSRTRIADTRKTTPGLRAFERYAVRCGGGHNHRDDLSAAILIKDNHIAAAGGVAEAIRRARAFAPHTSKIECEVDTFAQLDEALAARADIVLLDNFDDTTLVEAVKKIDGRAIVEVSGGVTLSRIAIIANAGVDVISSGALTHSAPAVDLGLDWLAENS